MCVLHSMILLHHHVLAAVMVPLRLHLRTPAPAFSQIKPACRRLDASGKITPVPFSRPPPPPHQPHHAPHQEQIPTSVTIGTNKRQSQPQPLQQRGQQQPSNFRAARVLDFSCSSPSPDPESELWKGNDEAASREALCSKSSLSDDTLFTPVHPQSPKETGTSSSHTGTGTLENTSCSSSLIAVAKAKVADDPAPQLGKPVLRIKIGPDMQYSCSLAINLSSLDSNGLTCANSFSSTSTAPTSSPRKIGSKSKRTSSSSSSSCCCFASFSASSSSSLCPVLLLQFCGDGKTNRVVSCRCGALWELSSGDSNTELFFGNASDVISVTFLASSSSGTGSS
eukprot:m.209537 g.209537  ORF g.209537 m.209537 type:complete len:338 (+) comp26107_c3_seq2:712-1725(+)